MSYQQEQEMNFRAVLGLDEKETPPVQELPEAPSAPEPTQKVKKEKRSDKQAEGEKEQKSIKVSLLLHRKLKLLSFWLDKNGIIDSATIPAVIEDALTYYLTSEARSAFYPSIKLSGDLGWPAFSMI